MPGVQSRQSKIIFLLCLDILVVEVAIQNFFENPVISMVSRPPTTVFTEKSIAQ